MDHPLFCNYQGKILFFFQSFILVFFPGNEELPTWPVVVSDAHQQHGEETEWDNVPWKGEKNKQQQQNSSKR